MLSSNSGTFDLFGNNQTVAGLTTNGSGTSNKVISSNTATAGTLTVNYSATGSQALAGALGGGATGNNFAFQKSGSGSFVLSGTNTYTGNTTVSAGTLAISTAASLPAASATVTVSSGALLDVSSVAGGYAFGTGRTLVVGRTTTPGIDINGAVTISGGTLSVGGTGVAATATFASGLTLDSSTNTGTLQFDLSSSPAGTNDQIAVNGNLTLLGMTAVNILALPNNVLSGTYTLITYTGTLTGSAANLQPSSGATRYSYVFDTSIAGQVNVTVSGGPANLTWVGNAASNVWDLMTTPNFSGATDNRFYNLDAVTFDNTGVGGTTPVTVAGVLVPGSVAINANQKLYL